MENNDSQFTYREIPLSLRFIIKAVSFSAHHRYLLAPMPDRLDFSEGFHFLIGIGTYIALLCLLVRVTLRMIGETYQHFQREKLSLKSLFHFIYYGLRK